MIQPHFRIRHGKQAAALHRLIPTAAAFAIALSAQAHPGHDWHDADARHLLTSPDHFALLALGGTLMWFGARLVQRRWPRRLMQVTGATACVLAAVLWGFRS